MVDGQNAVVTSHIHTTREAELKHRWKKTIKVLSHWCCSVCLCDTQSWQKRQEMTDKAKRRRKICQTIVTYHHFLAATLLLFQLWFLSYKTITRYEFALGLLTVNKEKQEQQDQQVRLETQKLNFKDTEPAPEHHKPALQRCKTETEGITYQIVIKQNRRIQPYVFAANFLMKLWCHLNAKNMLNTLTAFLNRSYSDNK